MQIPSIVGAIGFFILFIGSGVILIKYRALRTKFICYNYSDKNRNQFYRLLSYPFVPIDQAELVLNAIVLPQLFYITMNSIGLLITLIILIGSILVNGIFYKYLSLLKFPIYGSQCLKFTLLVTCISSSDAFVFFPPDIKISILPFIQISFLMDAILLIARFSRRTKTHYLHMVSVIFTTLILVFYSAQLSGRTYNLNKLKLTFSNLSTSWNPRDLCDLK